MAKFRFIQREDGFGEDPVDIHRCLRIRIGTRRTNPDGNLLHFYLTRRGCWIERRGDYEYDQEGRNFYWDESWKFVDKMTVAHALLETGMFDGVLPHGLEECRDIASDTRRYLDWKWPRNHEADGSDRLPPSWKDRVLTVSGRELKRYRNESIDRSRQVAILDAFQKNQWRNPISSPFGEDIRLLDSTLVDIKKALKPDSPIVFSREGYKVSWSFSPFAEDKNI